MKDLFLTIKGKYFEEIRLGKKCHEYRRIKPFFEKKLIGKTYDTVTFQNGYFKNSPRLTAKYLGYSVVNLHHPFFGKDLVQVFSIEIGEILKTENCLQKGTQIELNFS